MMLVLLLQAGKSGVDCATEHELADFVKGILGDMKLLGEGKKIDDGNEVSCVSACLHSGFIPPVKPCSLSHILLLLLPSCAS